MRQFGDAAAEVVERAFEQALAVADRLPGGEVAQIVVDAGARFRGGDELQPAGARVAVFIGDDAHGLRGFERPE